MTVSSTTAPDPDTATLISGASTAGSLALIGVGIGVGIDQSMNIHTRHMIGGILGGLGGASLLITPVLGHVYGEDRWLTTGTKLRIAGAAGLGVGLVLAVRDLCFDCASQDLGPGLLVVAGAGTFVIGMAYDMMTAGTATQRHNDRYRLSVAPTALVTPGSRTAAGLGVSGVF